MEKTVSSIPSDNDSKHDEVVTWFDRTFGSGEVFKAYWGAKEIGVNNRSTHANKHENTSPSSRPHFDQGYHQSARDVPDEFEESIADPVLKMQYRRFKADAKDAIDLAISQSIIRLGDVLVSYYGSSIINNVDNHSMLMFQIVVVLAAASIVTLVSLFIFLTFILRRDRQFIFHANSGTIEIILSGWFTKRKEIIHFQDVKSVIKQNWRNYIAGNIPVSTTQYRITLLLSSGKKIPMNSIYSISKKNNDIAYAAIMKYLNDNNS